MGLFKRKKQEQEVTSVQGVVDYTLLDPRTTDKDLSDCCNIAIKNKYYGVCVNGYNVEFVRRYIASKSVDNLKVIAVVGFPLGASALSVKVAETKQVINDGADEIDVVINIGAAKHEGRQAPQASSAFRTPTAGSLQSWDRRVRPRLV